MNTFQKFNTFKKKKSFSFGGSHKSSSSAPNLSVHNGSKQNVENPLGVISDDITSTASEAARKRAGMQLAPPSPIKRGEIGSRAKAKPMLSNAQNSGFSEVELNVL